MDLQNYKPQSHKYKSDQQSATKPAAGEERPKVNKVVTGEVTKRKKSPATKFADIFISEDAANVKSYIFMDVLVPAIKKAISDIVTDGIDMILYGGTGRSRRRSGGGVNATYVDYTNRSYRDDRRREDDRYRSRSMYDFDDIEFKKITDAEDVLEGLEALIDAYGMARVSDLYDLVGMSCEYTANNYGWTSLGGNARPERIRGGGYVLRLPRPMPIGR